MESLKISYKNFWVLLYKFIFLTGFREQSNNELPDNTCNFRRDIIVGAFALIVLLPSLLVYNVLLLIFPKLSLGGVVNYKHIGAFAFGMIVFYALWSTVYGVEIGILSIYQANGIMIIGLAIVGLIISIIVGILMLIEYLDKKKVFSKLLFSKFTFAKEMYNSAKEKYCKKIDYI